MTHFHQEISRLKDNLLAIGAEVLDVLVETRLLCALLTVPQLLLLQELFHLDKANRRIAAGFGSTPEANEPEHGAPPITNDCAPLLFNVRRQLGRSASPSRQVLAHVNERLHSQQWLEAS